MENDTKKALEFRKQEEPNSEILDMDANLFSIKVSECTTPLLDLIFKMDFDLESINNLHEYLWSLYDKDSCAIVMGIIKSLYLLNRLETPQILDTILLSKNEDQYARYSYEFLMDMNEKIEDFE